VQHIRGAILCIRDYNVKVKLFCLGENALLLLVFRLKKWSSTLEMRSKIICISWTGWTKRQNKLLLKR